MFWLPGALVLLWSVLGWWHLPGRVLLPLVLFGPVGG